MSVLSSLSQVYWQGPPIPGSNYGGNYGILPTSVNTAIKAATSGGAVVGQLGFGWLADVIGRRKMYGVELAIIILATLAQSLAAPSQAVTMTGLLLFWRVVMGIGIGGDYPLSAIITSEYVNSHFCVGAWVAEFRGQNFLLSRNYREETVLLLIPTRFAPTRWRGAMMAAVFSMQGAGQFAAALVALVTTVAFKDSFLHTKSSWSSCNDACQLAGDRAWRIIVGFGAVPAIFALYYRITIPETPRYTFDVARDIEKAQADIKAYVNNQAEGDVDPILQHKMKQKMGKNLATPNASWPDVFSYFSQWKNFKVIFGTTSSWFFLDLAFYGLGLNNTTVLSAIGYSTGATIYHTLLHNAIGNLVLVCAGSIPGYWLTVGTVDTIGRRPIQIIGFFFLTIIFCIIGFAYKSLSEGSLLALYVLAQLFFNFGPNTTTFIIPGECFPTRYRSTGHGLSAACGKVGAIIAQVIAPPLLAKGATRNCTGSACSPWLNHLMQIFALFMLCGTIVSFLVPETKGRTLEELAGEGSTPLDRNGSVTIHNGTGNWVKGLNPFVGGRPAGFSWNRSPNLGPRSPGILGKRERIGIMTSPELLPKAEEKHGKHGRATSENSANGYSVSVSSNGRNMEVDDDTYINGVNSSPLPGWGAGWAVQRHPRTDRGARVESIMLQDVGKLLK